jgi:hypothetical protein
MITNSEDLKKIQTALEELQKNLGIQDDEDFNENESYDFSYLKETYGFDMDELEKNLMSPKTTLDVKIQKINEDAVFPTYNYQTDSGFDFYSVKEVTIGPFGRALIPTGLRFDLPSNIELQVRSKSGLAINQGLFVLNSPGTVDSGYLGEIKVIKWKYAGIVFNKFFFYLSILYFLLTFFPLIFSMSNFYNPQ